jgi:hypothetical protein
MADLSLRGIRSSEVLNSISSIEAGGKIGEKIYSLLPVTEILYNIFF